jgi:hypothetical protein
VIMLEKSDESESCDHYVISKNLPISIFSSCQVGNKQVGGTSMEVQTVAGTEIGTIGSLGLGRA